jgi:hypothetical protein
MWTLPASSRAVSSTTESGSDTMTVVCRDAPLADARRCSAKFHRKRVAIATGVAIGGMAAAAAVASPPVDFFATNLVSEAELVEPVDIDSDGVKLQTEGPVDVRVQEATIAPGGRRAGTTIPASSSSRSGAVR